MLYDFSYQNPTRIHFGKNAINKLANEIKEYGENILLVYGKASIKKIGLYDQVINILQAEGKHVVELAGINANPRYTQLLEGARLCVSTISTSASRSVAVQSSTAPKVSLAVRTQKAMYGNATT